MIRPIGHGAAATVYLAAGPDSQPLAAKLFLPRAKSRAKREWEVGHELHHPNINPVFDESVIDGLPVVIMGLARGLPFNLGGFSSHFRVTKVFPQLLAALAHLHGKGFVHRDVKPENLIVERDGTARLVDFDLAGPVGEKLSPEFWVGTPAFVAPEQIEGAPSSFASDIYSAGLVLYWSLFGCLPFDGSPEEVAVAHQAHEVVLPTSLANSGLKKFLLTCLAKDPAQRFQSASEAHAAFLALFQGLPGNS